MTVEIKPEDEEIIAENVRNGLFSSVDDLIHHAIMALARRDSDSPGKTRRMGKRV